MQISRGAASSAESASALTSDLCVLSRKTWRNRQSRLRRWKRAYHTGARATLLNWSSVFLPLPLPPGLEAPEKNMAPCFSGVFADGGAADNADLFGPGSSNEFPSEINLTGPAGLKDITESEAPSCEQCTPWNFRPSVGTWLAVPSPCALAHTGNLEVKRGAGEETTDILQEIWQHRDMQTVLASVDRFLENLAQLVPDPPAVEDRVKRKILQCLGNGPVSPCQLLEQTSNLRGNAETGDFAKVVASCVRSLSSLGLITAVDSRVGGKALVLNRP